MDLFAPAWHAPGKTGSAPGSLPKVENPAAAGRVNGFQNCRSHFLWNYERARTFATSVSPAPGRVPVVCSASGIDPVPCADHFIYVRRFSHVGAFGRWWDFAAERVVRHLLRFPRADG